MIEQTILASMIHNEGYVRKVLPFLKDEYFDDQNEKFVYGLFILIIKVLILKKW